MWLKRLYIPNWTVEHMVYEEHFLIILKTKSLLNIKKQIELCFYGIPLVKNHMKSWPSENSVNLYIICGVYRGRFLFLTTQLSMWNIFLFVVIILLKYPFEKGLTSWLLEVVCTPGTVPYHPWSFFSTATVFSPSAAQGYIGLADQDTLMGNIHCRAPYQVG